jgi:gliding motility-associated-like protein
MYKKFFHLVTLTLFFVFLVNNLLAQSIEPSGTTSFCPGGKVELRVKDAPAGSTFQWTRNAENIVGANSITYTATSEGVYSVIVSGGEPLKSVTVTIHPLPSTPVFTFTPSEQCSQTPVQFVVTSPVPGVNYTWDFGDSETGSGTSVSHVYGALGNGIKDYKVFVTAKNSFNCVVNSASQTVKVLERPDATIADYTSNTPFTNCGGAAFTLTIDNMSSTVTTNTLYKIDWGDGSPVFSTEDLPGTGTSHTYSKLGYSTLVLTVTGKNGCTATKNYSVYNGSNPEVPFINPGSSIGLCVPFTFSVPSTNTNNPPGTRYIVSKNDGTADEVFSSLPSIYTHTFTETSCGATGGITPNTFFVNFRADNPCGFSDLTVQPITTSKKPVAKISVSPDSNACINSTLNFTNTSIAGTTVNNSGVCDNTTLANWIITPSTGWNVTNGALGNQTPSNNPSTWGSTNLGVSFVSPGVYKVSLIVRNICGNDTITQNVCIRNPPTASFTRDKKSICINESVKFTNTSPVGNCGGERYTWNLRYADTENCGGTNGASFVNGTTNTSANPEIKFSSPGRYIIDFTVFANASGCVSTVASDTIYVKDKPNVSLPNLAGACEGNALNPTATVVNCYSSSALQYTWTFNGGNPATSSNAIPGAINYSTNGTFPITLKVTNECGDATATTNVSIGPKPTANAGTDVEICSGVEVTIGATAISNVNYEWSPTIGLSSPKSASTKVNLTYNGSAADTTYKFVLKAYTGADCYNTDTVLVKVKKAPVVSILPASVSICSGSSTELVASGATTYSWSPSTGLSDVNGSTVIASPNVTTNYTVTGTAGNGCSDTKTVTVSVVPFTPANAGADKEYCSGSSVTIGTKDEGMNYSWLPAIGLDNPNSAMPKVSYVYNGPSEDTTLVYTLTASAGSNCTSTDEVKVKVKRSPLVTISSSNTSICSGSNTELVASGAATYSWSPSTGLSDVKGSTVKASPNVTTNYTVIGTAGNGCYETKTVTVSVVLFTPANAGADKEYCSGSSVTIGTKYEGMNYSWSPAIGLDNPNSAMPKVSYVYNGPSEDTTLVYTLTASAGSNCTSTDEVKVKVKRSPLISVTPSAADICVGGNVTLVANGADTYTWSPTTGLSSSSGATVVASPSTTTTYSVIGRLNNGCELHVESSINVKAVPVVNAGKDTVTCNNTSIVELKGNQTGGTWTGHTNVSNDGIFNPQAAGNGKYKLYYTLSANGCEGKDSLVVTVTDPPVVDAGKDTSFCAAGGKVKLKGEPAGGRWGGNTVINPDGTLDLSVAGVYQLVYTVGAGACIASDTVMVTIGNAVTNNIITSTQGICSGDIPLPLIGSEALAGSYAISYQWQSSLDSLTWNNIVGATDKDLTLSSTTQTIYFRRVATTDLCAIGLPSNVVKIYIHPNAKAEFNPTHNIDCAPFELNSALVRLSPYIDRNTAYRWFVNGDFIGESDAFSGYTMMDSGDTINLKLVTISRFGCLNDSTETRFITRSVAVPSFSKDIVEGCGPLVVMFTNNTADRDRYQYVWDFGNGQSSTDAQPSPIQFAINPNYGDTVYLIKMTTFNECKTTVLEDSVIVRSKPKSLFTPDIVEGCSPMKVTFTHTSKGSNASFVWDFGDGSPLVPATSSSIQHVFNTGVKDTFYVKLYGSNDCGNDTMQYAIVVNPNSIRLDFALNGNQKNVCAPDTILFVNNTTGANQFVWDFGDGSPKLTTTKGIDSVYHEYKQRGVFTVTLFGTNGCSDTTSTEIVTVEEKPNISFNATPQQVCVGDAIQLNNNSDSDLAWAWNFGDGTSSSQSDPSKRYTIPGTYNLTLTGTKIYPQGFGCSDSHTVNIIVNGPDGELRYKSGFVCFGDILQLETLSNNTDSYTYYLGNGDSIVTSNNTVNYKYPNPGYYIPSVLLRAGNCTKLLKGIDTVKIDQIKVDFKITTLYACGATTVNLNDQTDAYFGIQKREWDFGDGTSSNLANPTKVYTNSGNYTVRLRIFGNSGCVSEKDTVINIIVKNYPVADILGDNIACTNNPILFTAASQNTNEPVEHNWRFGNGKFGVGNTASTIYNNTGIYTVTLISRTSFGCADTAFKQITVRQSPTVRASADVRICLGQSTQLQASGADTYQWSPIEGISCSDCFNPTASPITTTQFVVKGTNAIGCSSTDSVTVQVVQPLKISVNENDTLCIGESAQLFASGADRYQWSPSVGLSATNIPNPIAKPNTTTIYRVIGFDSYNCFTDTAFTTVAVGRYPTVELGKGDTVVAGTAITFKPVLTNGPFKNFYWTPSKGLSADNIENPVATINNPITYTLVAENIYGCTATDTISYFVTCSKDDQVYIPNAFSPDGDGVNDVFMVYGKGIKVDYFRIYNRWGQLVFDGGSNYLPNVPQSGWDGKVGGKLAAQDVYVYMVQVRCTAGGTFTYKGNVSLLLMR